MATMRVTRASPMPAVLIVAAVLFLLLLSKLPRVPVGMPTSTAVDLPELSAHALEHSDAKVAWNWVRQKGRFCKWRCDDGRDRFVCPMPENRWALVVMEAQRLVTAFTTNQGYANTAIENCRNPWKYSHP